MRSTNTRSPGARRGRDTQVTTGTGETTKILVQVESTALNDRKRPRPGPRAIRKPRGPKKKEAKRKEKRATAAKPFDFSAVGALAGRRKVLAVVLATREAVFQM